MAFQLTIALLAKPEPQHETETNKHQEGYASEVLHYYYQYHTAGTQNFMTTTQNTEEPHLWDSNSTSLKVAWWEL